MLSQVHNLTFYCLAFEAIRYNYDFNNLLIKFNKIISLRKQVYLSGQSESVLMLNLLVYFTSNTNYY